jgi:glycosyltransferase involved in cell wall biosynthesis
LKIALVNQPIGKIVFEDPSQPLHADSLGLWDCHVARQCRQMHDASVISRAKIGANVTALPGGVPVHIVADEDRSVSARAVRKISWKLNNLSGEKRDRPHFASRSYCADYGAKVAEVIRDNDVDLVHIHNFFQLAPIIKKKNPNVKISLHMQCEWLSQLDKNLLQEGVDNSDFLSGCSGFIARGIKARFPDRAKDAFPLLNGVDTSLFTPRPPERRNNGVEVLFIGRVSPEKGVHVLLEAFKQVTQAIPNARLRVVGGRWSAPYDYICRLDPDPLVQAMEGYFRNGTAYQTYVDELASTLPEGSVEFIPAMPQAKLLEAFQRADVFVFPSVWNEPFGMPIIEAMACGKPVVSTYSGGIPEFVHENEDGLLVDRGDARKLGDALIALGRDAAMREAYGTAGRSFVENNLTWKHVAGRWLDNALVTT